MPGSGRPCRWPGGVWYGWTGLGECRPMAAARGRRGPPLGHRGTPNHSAIVAGGGPAAGAGAEADGRTVGSAAGRRLSRTPPQTYAQNRWWPTRRKRTHQPDGAEAANRRRARPGRAEERQRWPSREVNQYGAQVRRGNAGGAAAGHLQTPARLYRLAGERGPRPTRCPCTVARPVTTQREPPDETRHGMSHSTLTSSGKLPGTERADKNTCFPRRSQTGLPNRWAMTWTQDEWHTRCDR